ncbi:MAG: flagellar motor switch protein FliN [Ruminococcus sp.]|jgi:flagellar motor switch protein FliN/FliY|nr:flagellar motor switch protein FliN [Ruminococcus sp.]
MHNPATPEEVASFNAAKIDAIGEIENITMGSAATAVSTLLNAKVWITTPKVEVAQIKDLDYPALEPSVHVRIEYIKGIEGFSLLVLKQNDVQLILNQLMGLPLVVTDDFEFDEINISAVCEVMNQMMGASATALSEILGMMIDISTPRAIVSTGDVDIYKQHELNPEDYVCTVKFTLTIDGVINSEFVTILSLELASMMAEKMLAGFTDDLNDLTGASSTLSLNDSTPSPQSDVTPNVIPVPNQPAEAIPAAVPPPAPPPTVSPPIPPHPSISPIPNPPDMSPMPTPPPTAAPSPPISPPPAVPPMYAAGQQGAIVPGTGQPTGMGQPPMPPGYPMPPYGFVPPPFIPPPPMQYAAPPQRPLPPQNGNTEFGAIDTSKLTKEQIRNLRLLMSVPMDVSIEIGSATKKVEEVLDFTQGTIFELDRPSSAPVDIVVNGNLIAKGDVVVVGDNFAVKITEIIHSNISELVLDKV